MRIRMRMFPDMKYGRTPTGRSQNTPVDASEGNRQSTNLTLDPGLKAWGKTYAKARHNESLSQFVERLFRSEQAKSKDRQRKAVA